MSIETVKTTINGVEYSLTYNPATEQWEGVMTAPSGSSFNLPGGYYGVSLVATDTASNTATADENHPVLGEDLRLFVRERQLPVISITSPGEGAYVTNSVPVFAFTLRDNAIGGGGDSGIDIDSLVFSIDGTKTVTNSSAGMVCTPVEGGYDCEYIPDTAIDDGEHFITINVKDNDNNSAVEKTRNFIVDTVAPSLNVTSPTDGLETNQEIQVVSGFTSDVTSAPVTVTISLNGVDQGEISVTEGGEFSKEIVLIEGINSIVVTATDMAGRATTATRTVTLKTSAPVFTSVVIEPNPLDAGETYTIKVKVQES